MKRTVEITFELSELRKDIIQPSDTQILRAIGRFTYWGGDAYDKVAIHKDGKTDMVAYFTHTKNDNTYVVGAVYRPDEKEYTFHS